MRATLLRPDYCDVCATPLAGGPVLVGRLRCCSIECVPAKPIERETAMRGGGYLSTPMRLEHAAAYYTRWR